MIEHAIQSSPSLWPQTTGGVATLVNLSENHTFRIDGPGGARHILRVHRPGYHTQSAIESELRWMEALRRERDLPVPRPLAGKNGEVVQRLVTDGQERFAVLFAFEEGVEPRADEQLQPLFETLGGYAARNHEHSQLYAPPQGIDRPRWDETVLDIDGIWGDWRAAPGVEPVRAALERLHLRLRDDLAAYGRDRDRFGLIHADMRLANLLVDGDQVTLIDFDDCGFGWFAYDFAAAVSFIDDQSLLPGLKAAWLRGYRRHRQWAAADEAAMDTLVLFRRMLLLAWTGTHAETELARSQAHLARLTAELGEAYMAQ